MANFFLWGGLTLFVALPPIALPVFSLAGWVMVVGFVLLLLGR